MISFIVIGKNEERNISNCIKSIIKSINNIKNKVNTEIIYVDSNSSDNTINIVSSFENVNVFKITSTSNAAIGRNIGAKHSKYKYLCFIDGDMEIIPNFIPSIIESKEIECGFISGQFKNIYYNSNFEITGSEIYKEIRNDKLQSTTGGLFIIKKHYWDIIQGMDSRFKMGEDLDLGLRMSKLGFKLLRKKELFALHHTISYENKGRKWREILNNRYSRSLLYRKNLFNISTIKRILTSDPTVILLVLSILLSIIINKLFLGIYLILLVVAVILKKPYSFLTNIVFQLIRDSIVLLSFFTFFPKSFNNIKYKKIK